MLCTLSPALRFDGGGFPLDAVAEACDARRLFGGGGQASSGQPSPSPLGGKNNELVVICTKALCTDKTTYDRWFNALILKGGGGGLGDI